MSKRNIAIAAMATVIAVARLAHAAPGDAIPPADLIDPVPVQWAVRACAAQAVAYLTNQAATDPSGWVVPPMRTHRHIGFTNMVLRYREVTTPLYEYENYTVYERRPGADSQSARTLQPVTRRRVKRVIDPEGGPKHLVEDKDGPITREVQLKVYDKTGPDRWPHGTIGQNSMALYALLGVGVAPDNPVMSILAEGLIRLVDDFGAPDNTWDLAWLTAGLARYPGEAAEEAARSCASKLLDGQILEGDARGMWGPASINIPLLAVAYQHEQELAARQAKAQLSAKEKPDSIQRQAAAVAAADDLLRFQRNMKRISMLAMAFDQIDHPYLEIGEDDYMKILTTGLAHYIFNQNCADLESTTLALFALREAAAAGRLPEETWRPEMAGTGGVPRPEKADAILARTSHALARLQTRTGDWTVSNIHQPVRVFDQFGKMVPGLPVDPKSFVPLPSPQTPLATLQGYAAYVLIGRTVGFEKALGRFRPNFAAGMAAARRQIAALPDYTPKQKLGGRVDPCEAFFFATPACDVPGTRRRELVGEWNRMAVKLATLLQTNGAWHAKGNVRIIPDSMQARIDTLPKRDYADRTSIMNRSVAHVRYNWTQGHYSYSYLGDRQVLATCHALMFLASGTHPPFLAATLGGEPRTLPATDIALDELDAATGVFWRFVYDDLKGKAPLLDGAPGLFLNGSADALGDTALRMRISNYVMGGGIVIAMGESMPGGLAFLDALVPVIAAGCGSGTTARDVAGEQAVLGELAGRLGRPLQGMTREDGSLAALLLTVGARADPEGTFSVPEAARVISTALRRNLDDTLLSPAYAHQLGDLGDPATLLQNALALVLASPTGTALPPPPVPPNDSRPAAKDASPAAAPAAGSAAKAAPAATTAAEEESAAKPPAPIQPPPPPQAPAADELW